MTEDVSYMPPAAGTIHVPAAGVLQLSFAYESIPRPTPGDAAQPAQGHGFDPADLRRGQLQPERGSSPRRPALHSLRPLPILRKHGKSCCETGRFGL